MTSALPEGVVASNINVSARCRPTLLAELRHDENLVWAHETIAPSKYIISPLLIVTDPHSVRTTMLLLLILALFFSAAGFAIAIALFNTMTGKQDVLFLCAWLPFLLCSYGS